MTKNLKALAYGSLLASALAAAWPSQAAGTREDRIGSPMQIVVPAGYIAAIPVVPADPSAVAGAGVPYERPALVTTTEPTILVDLQSPTDQAFVISTQGRPWINVNYGDTVDFLVRDPQGNNRRLKWRFDGMDNVVNFADIDPLSNFASNLRIFVNQSYNPMRSSESGINPL
jgi:hypothetical protein